MGAIGLLVAFVLGIFIGGSEVLRLLIIFGVIALMAIIASMRQNVWLLIPMFWGFTGFVPLMPLPFSVRDLSVMLVGGIGFALLTLRIYRFRSQLGLLDLFLFLNLAQVGLAFIAHPTGFRSFSSESVGAKPYFEIAIAILAYLVVSNQVIPAKLSRALPVFILIPEAISSILTLAIRIKPSLAYVLGLFYSSFLPSSDPLRGPVVERIAVGSGNTLVTTLCSYFRPLTLLSIGRPIRFLLFMIGITLILISGFRSQLAGAVAIFVLASYFRKGIPDVIIVLTGIFMALLMIILVNSIYPLPLAVQRTLSFLPGHWDPRAASDARGSTEWRLEMWQDAAKSTRYIRDRVMGDGFGFSRAELQAMDRQRYATGIMSQEDSMIIGAFHNGPLSTIRFVGVVGLVLYYALIIYTAIYAWRLIRASGDFDYYPLALFVGLPLIWEPFNYTLVFGGYDSGLPNTIFGIGMLKMIHNSLQSTSKEKTQNVSRLSPVEKNEPIPS